MEGYIGGNQEEILHLSIDKFGGYKTEVTEKLRWERLRSVKS